MSQIVSVWNFLLKHWLVSTVIVIGILAATGYLLRGMESSEVVSTNTARLPIVTLTTASRETGDFTLELLGTTRPLQEATVTAEASGRVTQVFVTLGQGVISGQIIAQLENAAERAALLQAEGTYEAALAGASQSVQQNDSGVRNAEATLETARNSVVTAIQTSFSTANNTLVATVDQFFSTPEGLNPGIRISRTNTTYLRTERIAFQTVIRDWRALAENRNYDAATLDTVTLSEANTQRLLQVIDHLIAATSNPAGNDILDGRPVISYTSALIAERTALVATLQGLRNARTTLAQAEEALARAGISDTTDQSALSDAQVKQALGALEAVRANLAKTTLRAPFAGTINALPVRTGDFVQNGTAVATIANNALLEVVTYLDVAERDALTTGDQLVIEGTGTGTVIAIAPAVDANTRKIEVRITVPSSANLVSGDTVKVRTESKTSTQLSSASIMVPLTAVQFQASAGSLFSVTEENVLVSIPVTLGDIRSGSVTVVSGIGPNDSFVRDARGLTAGDEVTIVQ